MAPPHQTSFGADEERLLQEWQYAQESTRHTVPVPADVMKAVLSLTREGRKEGERPGGDRPHTLVGFNI